jgi:5'-deoxynucleotidase YfbR-like HD superfamily hydrolase
MEIIIAIILVFVIADILIVGYILYRRFRKKISPQIAERIRNDWKRIIKQADHRHAIMDADKLLDYALSQMGFKGSLGAKLKKAPSLFSNINAVWEAHKVRNNIAHKINYRVDEKTYKKTMLQFKQAFKDLKIF